MKIIDDSEYILNVGEDYFRIGKSAEKKWGLLRDLALGRDTKRAIKNNYESNHSLNALDLEGLGKHLENGDEEDLSDEILSVLERFTNQYEGAKA